MSSSKFLVYLAGPISGCSDIQKHKWRDDVKKKYAKDFDFIDPTEDMISRRSSPQEFVEADLGEIKRSNGILANMWRESIGTTLGVVHASRIGRPVVVADPNHLRHRMLQFHADAVVDSALKAAKALRDMLGAEASWKVRKSGGRQEAFARRKIIASVAGACRRTKNDDIVVPRIVLPEVIAELEKSDRWIDGAVTTTDIDNAIRTVFRRWERKRDLAFAGLTREWKRSLARKRNPRAAFVKEPRPEGAVRVDVSSGKSHSTVWGKAVRELGDIPSARARDIVRAIASVRGVAKIALRRFGHGESRADCCASIKASKEPFVIDGTLFDDGPRGTWQAFQVYVQVHDERDGIIKSVVEALEAQGLSAGNRRGQPAEAASAEASSAESRSGDSAGIAGAGPRRSAGVASVLLLAAAAAFPAPALAGQGVTTGGVGGFVYGAEDQPLTGASVVAVHVESGTRYSAVSRADGAFSLPNMRVGGPYAVTAEMIGHAARTEEGVFVLLGQTVRVDLHLEARALEIEGIEVEVPAGQGRAAGRTGAATSIGSEQVVALPSIKRTTRDLVRVDPRNDGNLAFAGRNWLYNNVSLDGSYFSNPFGLDDPAPGGQANAEPVPFDAVEQVHVSVAPFDVREGGFTGANVNTVTKSGTNRYQASAYTFARNESLIGNRVEGNEVSASPDLSFNQSGVTASGPVVRDKLLFFVNAEIERRDDPGTDFVASGDDGAPGFGESRVRASVMDSIRARMMSVYGYDPGPYQGYVHETDNDKLLAKLDWNVSDRQHFTFRYSYLDARREQGPHPAAISFNNAGRGPNGSSLPFRNAGYAINNRLHSFALELNSRGDRYANRFFASYNRFRDTRDPFSADYPTIEIGEGGIGYTTLGHEPFSIRNVVHQDVLQFTNNATFYRGRHALTAGANFETFGFFNSFNLFRHGLFFLPWTLSIGSTFASLDEFFAATEDGAKDFDAMIGVGPYKGETTDIGQLSLYAQDEFSVGDNLDVTAGLRVDIPLYFTEPVDNPFSRGLAALDRDGNPETVDQSALPGATPLLSPRLGFNWDVRGDGSTRLRGGTGVFTGRIPFVWVGNVISNPGANPNIWAPGANEGVPQVQTAENTVLQQTFDLNALDADFRWPQVWVTDLAVDQQLPGGWTGTLEVLYGNDVNAVVVRNADLAHPQRTLRDGRPYYGGPGAHELNPDGGAGIYVMDNSSQGYNFNLTAQLGRSFASGSASAAYAFTQAKNNMKTTEIASVMWQNLPMQGDPNNPRLSWSEFGPRHRFTASGTYTRTWSERFATHFGLFAEVAQGGRFTAAGGNRFSFVYAGDVNGDGQAGNDLIYIPRDAGDINLANPSEWALLDAFIEQDPYLSRNRGRTSERMGALAPWFSSLDVRILQDVRVRGQTVQISLDILNVGNLLNSAWGVRKIASPAATSPLRLVEFDGTGEPVFEFTGPDRTFMSDPGVFSRWRIQMGARVMLR